MKNLIATIAVGVVVFVLIELFFPSSSYDPSAGIKSKNVSIVASDEATVTFRVVCPECGHQGSMYDLRITEGEKDTRQAFCEKCYKVFEYEIDRS